MTPVIDDEERRRVLTDLESTLLVEAGAGTGKTSLLAGRVVMLLASGMAPRSIVAITFTELAAGELRHRISAYLDALLGGSVPRELRLCMPDGATPEQKLSLTAAAERLDEMICGTIHGFCHDLLRSYSVEARIDPGAEVLDADQADFVFDSIFDRWWRDRLDRTVPVADDPIASVARKDPVGAEDLLRGFAKFRRRYRAAKPPPSDLDPKAELEFVESVREFRRWCDHVDVPPEADPDIVALEALASHFGGTFDPLPGFERLWELAHPPSQPIMRKGAFALRDYRRRSLWRRKAGKEAGDRLADQAEEYYARCRTAYGTLMGRIATAIIGSFSNELAGVLEGYEAFKRRAAVLDFDDLLYTCRQVLRDFPLVRNTAGERFSRILVDEFQDTDPVQAEIVFLLCSAADATTWHKRPLRPGQLFVVGDPKQAIYRFRGADLATYLTVRQAIEEQFPDNVVRVSANFRSREPILHHINQCFALHLSQQEAGYVALQGTRSASDRLPGVAKVSVELPPDTRVASARDEEARVVAELCAKLIGNVELTLNDGKIRRLAPGDIALLAPVSTDLWRYERALEEIGLPFASQAGRNLFKRQEAQDLVALIRTLADARDTLALGALLRGPLVGLTERELLDIAAGLPPSEDPDQITGLTLMTDPAAVQHDTAREVLGVLRDLRRRVNGTSPALILAEAIARLQVRAIIGARSADQAVRSLANIDGLLERARSYRVRGFAQFARDIDEEWSGGSSSAEGMVEADGQSIEIVTVHSSKGLEWPVVIPINRASMPRRTETFVYRRSDESLHWALGQLIPPSLGDALLTEEAEKRAENLRLLYVACTRAMESLILPDFTWSNDESWAKLLSFRPDTIPQLNVSSFSRASISPPRAAENLQTAQIFAEERSRLDAMPQVRWIAPSDGDPDVIAEQLASEASDDEQLGPLSTIEGGRIRGILLHKLMEELVTGELEDNLATATSRAAELCDQLLPVSSSTASVKASELAEAALKTLQLPDLKPFRSRLVAEVPIYAVTPNGPDHLIAGRADAIAEADDGGLVVFDWKSDIAPKEADRAAYRQQLARYLYATGAQRGAVVYMTSGRMDWVSSSS